VEVFNKSFHLIQNPLIISHVTNVLDAHTDIHALSGIRTHDPNVCSSENSVCVKLGIECVRLPRASVRARQTRSFVYRVRVQHRSAAAACGC
jgi:hypothetical protein